MLKAAATHILSQATIVVTEMADRTIFVRSDNDGNTLAARYVDALVKVADSINTAELPSSKGGVAAKTLTPRFYAMQADATAFIKQQLEKYYSNDQPEMGFDRDETIEWMAGDIVKVLEQYTTPPRPK